jgi:hypothetical protein
VEPRPTDGASGLTRRSLLARASAGGAALMLGAPAFARAATAPVRYLTGFNESWVGLEAIEYASVAAAGAARYLRQSVSWDGVERTQGTYDWSAYAGLKRKAQANGVKVLPIFVSCPSWARPMPGSVPICSPEYDSAFGQFVAAGLAYFGTAVTHGEIWNEPNSNGLGPVPPERFASLLQNAHNWVWAYNQQRLFVNGEERFLVSGGLAMLERGARETAIFWSEYLRTFQERTNAAYNVGVHPYDLTDHTGQTSEAAAAALRSSIMRQFDEAKALTTRNLWVTETGCSSRDPWSQRGQAIALAGIMNGFNQRGRCRAVLVHRLYDDIQSEAPGSAFYRYGVRWDSETGHTREAKLAYGELRRAWLEQPV